MFRAKYTDHPVYSKPVLQSKTNLKIPIPLQIFSPTLGVTQTGQQVNNLFEHTPSVWQPIKQKQEFQKFLISSLEEIQESTAEEWGRDHRVEGVLTWSVGSSGRSSWGSSGRSRSRERTTLATTGLALAGSEEEAEAACQARETTGGHFMSHTERSARAVSRYLASSAIVLAAAARLRSARLSCYSGSH